MSTGKPKDTDICCEDIDTISAKECDTKSHLNFVNECANGDLNLFVEKLLNSTGIDNLKEQGIEVDEPTKKLLTVNKRKRKTKKQVEYLQKEYNKNPNWSKEYMQKLADELNMTASSIYKWHWDQKNKKHEKKTTKTNKREQKKEKKSTSKNSQNTAGNTSKSAKYSE